MNSRGKIFVLSSPSGGGKTSLKDRLLKSFPKMRYSISATTRQPREGEKNGIHYHFCDRDEFKKMIDSEELIEFMEVHGNYYGTPKKPIEDSLNKNEDIVMDLDVYGKVNFDKIYPEAIGILIIPPSLQELERRLIARKSDTPETIRLRLYNASTEMDYARKHGKYEFTVVNDSIERAFNELVDIVSSETGKKPFSN